MKELLHLSKNFSVVRDALIYNDDAEVRITEYIEQPPVVIAVAVVADSVVLVEHLRPILNERLLECPGGKADPGESLEEAMRRELSEEVGLRTHRVTELGSFYSSVGTSTERIHIFRAEALEQGQRSASDAKRMRIVRVPIDDVKRRMSVEPFRDGKTQIALALSFGMEARRL